MRNKYEVRGTKIKLFLDTKGGSRKVAWVSMEHLEKLLGYDVKWCHLDKGTNTQYVTANEYVGDGKNKTIQLHRFLVDALTGLVVNHINGNGLDNRIENLEIVTNQENTIKRVYMNSNNTSGVRGVSYDKSRDKWQVKFKKDYKMFHYGRFDSLEEARSVAETALKELFNLSREA